MPVVIFKVKNLVHFIHFSVVKLDRLWSNLYVKVSFKYHDSTKKTYLHTWDVQCKINIVIRRKCKQWQNILMLKHTKNMLMTLQIWSIHKMGLVILDWCRKLEQWCTIHLWYIHYDTSDKYTYIYNIFMKRFDSIHKTCHLMPLYIQRRALQSPLLP